MTPSIRVGVSVGAAIASAAFLSACGESGPSPIGRDEITAAFSRIEVLVLEKDVNSTNPGSRVDAVYIPASTIVEPSFRVVLYDDEDAAETRVRALARSLKTSDFFQLENAILVFTDGVARQDRAELTAVLSSLQND